VFILSGKITVNVLIRAKGPSAGRALQIENIVFLLVPCILVEVYRRFINACCLHHYGTHRPHDGGNKHY
jgi:hypothetical protein